MKKRKVPVWAVLSEGLLSILALSSVDNQGAGHGESLREKMNHTVEKVCECVRFTGGATDTGRIFQPGSPGNGGEHKMSHSVLSWLI